jgi:hypothetical protein
VPAKGTLRVAGQAQSAFLEIILMALSRIYQLKLDNKISTFKELMDSIQLISRELEAL